MDAERGNLGFVDDAVKRMHDTVNVLRDRATLVEAGLQQRVATGGAAEARQPDLAAVQASIRRVLRLIEENPVPAALLALGAGVIATSMWSERNGGRPSRSRGRRSDREE